MTVDSGIPCLYVDTVPAQGISLHLLLLFSKWTTAPFFSKYKSINERYEPYGQRRPAACVLWMSRLSSGGRQRGAALCTPSTAHGGSKHEGTYPCFTNTYIESKGKASAWKKVPSYDACVSICFDVCVCVVFFVCVCVCVFVWLFACVVL